MQLVIFVMGEYELHLHSVKTLDIWAGREKTRNVTLLFSEMTNINYTDTMRIHTDFNIYVTAHVLLP